MASGLSGPSGPLGAPKPVIPERIPKHGEGLGPSPSDKPSPTGPLAEATHAAVAGSESSPLSPVQRGRRLSTTSASVPRAKFEERGGPESAAVKESHARTQAFLSPLLKLSQVPINIAIKVIDFFRDQWDSATKTPVQRITNFTQSQRTEHMRALKDALIKYRPQSQLIPANNLKTSPVLKKFVNRNIVLAPNISPTNILGLLQPLVKHSDLLSDKLTLDIGQEVPKKWTTVGANQSQSLNKWLERGGTEIATALELRPIISSDPNPPLLNMSTLLSINNDENIASFRESIRGNLKLVVEAIPAEKRATFYQMVEILRDIPDKTTLDMWRLALMFSEDLNHPNGSSDKLAKALEFILLDRVGFPVPPTTWA